jgi:hypothetical protein
MVRILWGFNIERRMDAAGNIMEIDIEDFTPGLTAYVSAHTFFFFSRHSRRPKESSI